MTCATSLSFRFLVGKMGILLKTISWDRCVSINVSFCRDDDEGGWRKEGDIRGLILPPDGLLVQAPRVPEAHSVQKGARYKLHPSVTFHDLINLMQQAHSAEPACHQEG